MTPPKLASWLESIAACMRAAGVLPGLPPEAGTATGIAAVILEASAAVLKRRGDPVADLAGSLERLEGALAPLESVEARERGAVVRLRAAESLPAHLSASLERLGVALAHPNRTPDPYEEP